jgi:hypothetical protein
MSNGNGRNDHAHPSGEAWKRTLSDEELQRMYRASGGGGTVNKGCIVTLLGALTCWALLGYGIARVVA